MCFYRIHFVIFFDSFSDYFNFTHTIDKEIKKTLQQLEDTLEQRDKALIAQKRREK